MRHLTSGIVTHPLILCLLFLLVLIPASHADNGARVVVVVANYISLDDLLSSGQDTRSLVNQSAVGLVNTGKYKKLKSPYAAMIRYLVLGAGARIEPPRDVVDCANAGEIWNGQPAGAVYSFQTAKFAPEESVVSLGFAKIQRENEKHTFIRESIGLLGDAFHKAGLRTAVIGNADIPDTPMRYAPFITMDSHGLVDAGSVGRDVTTPASDNPCGFKDDQDAMINLAKKYMADHALVVIELGDFSRLESMKEDLSDKAYALHRKQCLQNLDCFISRISPMVSKQGATLVICSPCRIDGDIRTAPNLTPVVIAGPHARRGILTSGTTRTNGLISNIDLAPTIIRLASLPVPDRTYGRTARIIHDPKPVDNLKNMEHIVSRNLALMIPVLLPIGIWSILAATLSEALPRRKMGEKLRKSLRGALLVSLSMPAALLLTDNTKAHGADGYIIRLAISTVVVLGLSYGVTSLISTISKRNSFSILASLHLMTAALICVDVLTGARLLRWSISICSPISGIRYYGMGNEYMGLLVGIALMGTLLAVRSAKNYSRWTWLIAICFALVAWVIGYPALGANVGGLLTAVAVYGTALIIMAAPKIRLKHWISVTAIACASVVAFGFVDVFKLGENSSHLGSSLSFARIYGWEYLGAMIAEKILMHVGILRLPQTYGLLLLSTPFFYLYGRRVRQESLKGDILYRAGLPAVIVGMIVAFLFNDSGIVPAMIILAVYAASEIWVHLGETST